MKNNINKLLLTLFVLIIGTLGAWAFSFRNMTLDFIHISDTHISTDRDDTSYKALSSSSLLLDDAIQQINSIKGLDFVLFTGDLVDSATLNNYREYYTLLSHLKYPSLNAFGNHDLAYGDLTKDEVLDIVKKSNRNYTFDDTYYAFSPKTDYRIIVLDSNTGNDSTANGAISPEQLRFLDNELNENQDKIVVIALHVPPVQPFVATEHSLINADEFNEILLKYKNPIVVLSGHYHAAKIRHWGNLTYISTPSMVTYPMAFRHIKITNYKDRVVFDFEFIPTRLTEIKEQNRKNVISYGTLAGNEKDRVLTYVYKKRSSKSANYKRNKIKNAEKSSKTKKSELKKLEKLDNVNSDELSNKKSKVKKEKIKKQKVKKEKVKKEKIKKEKKSKFNFFKKRKNIKAE